MQDQAAWPEGQSVEVSDGSKLPISSLRRLLFALSDDDFQPRDQAQRPVKVEVGAGADEIEGLFGKSTC
jgi:hypothetical protein